MRRPRAYSWYVRYVVVMAVLYLACTAGALFLRNADLDMSTSMSEAEALRFQLTVVLIVCPALFVLLVAGLFIPRRPWGWVYGLVMICLGLTSICTWPVTIPLLIRWFGADMKAYFWIAPDTAWGPADTDRAPRNSSGFRARWLLLVLGAVVALLVPVAKVAARIGVRRVAAPATEAQLQSTAQEYRGQIPTPCVPPDPPPDPPSNPPAATGTVGPTNSDRFDNTQPAPAGRSTKLTFVGCGGFVAGSDSYSYTPTNARISTLYTYRRAVRVIIEAQEHWMITFGPPAGQVLVRGVYADVESFPPDGPDSAGFHFAGDGRGCSRSRSTFTIYEINIVNDTVTRLLATFEHHCETPDAPPSLGVVDFTT